MRPATAARPARPAPRNVVVHEQRGAFGAETLISLLTSAAAISEYDAGSLRAQVTISRHDSPVVRRAIAAARDRFRTGRFRAGVLTNAGRVEVCCFVDQTHAGGVVSFGRVLGDRPLGVIRLTGDQIHALERALDALEGDREVRTT